MEGLISTKGNLRFKIDCASLIAESKFTIFALFYFVFEGNFPSTSLRGAYTRRGLFSEFYGILLPTLTFPFIYVNLRKILRASPKTFPT